MLEVLAWVMGVVAVLLLAGFIHHRIKLRTDPYYRYQVEQGLQDRAVARAGKELQRLRDRN